MLAIVVALLAAPVQATPRDPLCAAASAVKNKACVATRHGVVLAPERAEAERLARAVEAGEQRFQRHFDRTPPRFAVVQDAKPGEAELLEGAGFRRPLPWLTPAQFETAVVQSLRRGAEAQAKAQGLTPDRAAEVAAKAEATWRARNGLQQRHEQDEGVVPHEVGHGWYIATFWPSHTARAGGHYGGPGPDWLDETAAVLMESDKLAQDRRDQFAQLYQGKRTNPALANLFVADLLDLRTFLTGEHPAKRSAFSIPAGAGGAEGPGVRVLAGEEARKLSARGVLYYLQARSVADFLVERSGDPAVFADIGAAFGRGETMEAWLRTRGGRYKLPPTIAGLTQAWHGWLAARYGGPSAATVAQ